MYNTFWQVGHLMYIGSKVNILLMFIFVLLAFQILNYILMRKSYLIQKTGSFNIWQIPRQYCIICAIQIHSLSYLCIFVSAYQNIDSKQQQSYIACIGI